MEHILKMEVRREDALKEAKEIREVIKKEDRAMTDEERDKFNRLMEKVDNIDEEIRQEKELAERAAQKKKPDPEKERAEWRSLGEFVRAVYANPADKRLQDRFVEVEERQQQMAVGEDGGFLVPDQFADDLLTVQPDEAIVRPRARVFPGGGDADFHIPALQYSGNNMFAGANVTWIDEGKLKNETDIEFKRITLHPFEVAAWIPVTDKLMRNAAMIEQIVRAQLRGALIDAEEATFLTGAGGAQPTGIIGHAATIQVNRNNANQVDYDDLAEMLSVYRGRGGVWIVGRDVLPQLMDLQDPANGYIWQPSARDGNPGRLFGMPVLFSDHSPALGTAGDVVLADLSNYLIKDGIGVAISASPHVRFTQNQTIIKAFKTVDGIPWLTGPLPTTVPTSPFVQLHTP